VHYSAAIAASLIANDFESARRMLTQMQGKEVESSDSALEAIGRSYALIATNSATFGKPNRTASKETAQSGKDSSCSRAKSAYAIVSGIANPSTSVLSL
jgi:hypothetical protein